MPPQSSKKPCPLRHALKKSTVVAGAGVGKISKRRVVLKKPLCDLCKKSFELQCQLDAHLYLKHLTKTYTCSLCNGFTCTTYNQFVAHNSTEEHGLAYDAAKAKLYRIRQQQQSGKSTQRVVSDVCSTKPQQTNQNSDESSTDNESEPSGSVAEQHKNKNSRNKKSSEDSSSDSESGPVLTRSAKNKQSLQKNKNSEKKMSENSENGSSDSESRPRPTRSSKTKQSNLKTKNSKDKKSESSEDSSSDSQSGPRPTRSSKTKQSNLKNKNSKDKKSESSEDSSSDSQSGPRPTRSSKTKQSNLKTKNSKDKKSVNSEDSSSDSGSSSSSVADENSINKNDKSKKQIIKSSEQSDTGPESTLSSKIKSEDKNKQKRESSEESSSDTSDDSSDSSVAEVKVEPHVVEMITVGEDAEKQSDADDQIEANKAHTEPSLNVPSRPPAQIPTAPRGALECDPPVPQEETSKTVSNLPTDPPAQVSRGVTKHPRGPSSETFPKQRSRESANNRHHLPQNRTSNGGPMRRGRFERASSAPYHPRGSRTTHNGEQSYSRRSSDREPTRDTVVSSRYRKDFSRTTYNGEHSHSARRASDREPVSSRYDRDFPRLPTDDRSTRCSSSDRVRSRHRSSDQGHASVSNGDRFSFHGAPSTGNRKLPADTSNRQTASMSADRRAPERISSARLGQREPSSVQGASTPAGAFRKCFHCDLFFPDVQLRDHVLEEHYLSFIRCIVCLKKIESLNFLENHIKIMHPALFQEITSGSNQSNVKGRLVKCYACKVWLTETMMDNHKAIVHKKMFCPVCRGICNTKKDAAEHVRRYHKKEYLDLLSVYSRC